MRPDLAGYILRLDQGVSLEVTACDGGELILVPYFFVVKRQLRSTMGGRHF